MPGEADSASACVRGGMPAEAGAVGAGPGLSADPQPAAGGRAAEKKSLRKESRAAAERAGSATGSV